jgi:16S rRNA (uracil1498-N3)-methyltransferase
MSRFYVPQPRIVDEILTIEGDEVKHIRKVLRLRPGDEIIIFDSFSKEYEGIIVEEGPLSILVRVRNVTLCQRESPLEVTLAQSLLKGEKMDYLVQKSTELGIKEIVPFFSSRSIPVLGISRGQPRHRRWERIAVEASKQCGRGTVPGISPAKSYSRMLQEAAAGSLRFVLWEKEGEKLKKILERSKEMLKIFFVVGPEGGLSSGEVDQAKQMGFIPVNLGKRILRSETAGVCLLSILQYELGDIG